MSDATAKPKISIEWITDHSDCEDCGPNYAEGAVVEIDGMEILDLSPGASCYGGTHYTKEEVYRRILETLGYPINETETSTGNGYEHDDWDD
ncbi:hypothetical protein G6L37_00475 [Agrobacterium rubi]|nr:hypothetical protein [Agrobacterium rubi]NTF23864.1 hypothetical protein [Agrobacterium rubi]